MSGAADNERFMRHWTQAQPVVASYINSVTGDFHVAEDLLQDVAVVLLNKFSEYDAQRPFVGWALGVARYEMLMRRRSQERSLLSPDTELLNTVAGVYEELAPELDGRARALRECRKTLKGTAESVLRLRYEEALKPAEIARRLGMEAGAIRVQLSRIRAVLQECVERRVAITGRRA
jgi:RNA polymerase sigma-70 factor (ECF subfamily)